MNYCTSCFRNAIYYGEIFFEFDFIKWGDDHYSIVQDHEEVYRFPEKPIYINPTFNVETEEEANELYKNEIISNMDDIFTAKVHEMKLDFHPQTGHAICEAAKKAGWNPDGHGWIDYWIMHRAATMIRTTEGLPPYDLDIKKHK